MERRKFLAGVGSLAAGSAAAMGTGAFNFANVERGVNVNLADDTNAFLGLTATSPYANDNGDSLNITFNGDSGSSVSGTGINENSDYSFRSVFEITNNGSQSVGVWLVDDDSNDAANWYAGNGFSDSIEGPGNAYALDPGQSIAVSVVFLTVNNDFSDLPDTVNVKADASAGN